MCRLAAYMGPDIFISSLVTEPKHSLIHQSYHAKERIEPLNGDGFGIGWYAPQFCDNPAMFKEVSPAWSNQNLRDIARVTKSTCIFAHVRAATIGGHLSRTNCHPFTWKNYMFMHNGTVFGFEKIRRSLRQQLSDESYEMVRGSTDSEHIFGLFTDRIEEFAEPTLDDMAESLTGAIVEIEKLKVDVGIDTPSTLNLVLSDGSRMVATRYVSKGDESNSLYYACTGKYSCIDGDCKMDEGRDAFLVVSEPLDGSQAWQRVENNQMILVDEQKQVSLRLIEV